MIKILLIIIFCISIAAGLAAVQVNGGYITRVDVTVNSYTERWLGFYGVITNNTMMIVNSYSKNNTATQHLFTGISAHDGDYLMITTSPSPPELSELQAGNLTSVDKITGWGNDSGSNTFIYSSNYRIPYSGAMLTDVPSIYMFDSREHYFREALVSDSNGNPVFAVPIESQGLRNASSHYFQLMLPDNGSLIYYFFYLSSDK